MTNQPPVPESAPAPDEGTTLLRSFNVKNYKSLVDVTLDLGRINVFIGENGSGKSNVLESVGMAAATLSERLTDEDIYHRGIRLARPSLLAGAFPDSPEHMRVVYEVNVAGGHESVRFSLLNKVNRKRFINYTVDQGKSFEESFQAKESKAQIPLKSLTETLEQVQSDAPSGSAAQVLAWLMHGLLLGPAAGGAPEERALAELLAPFVIYNLSTLALRGLQVESRRTPLGIHGEGLDVLIAQMSPEEREQLSEDARVVSWVEGIEIDTEGTKKFQDYKPARSRSELYFQDKFMDEKNRTFSAENANEGILHVLFYLALFMSPKTPSFFAIDNIETALNPRLLRHLVKRVTSLAKAHGKQALITTHNPAALDGLNLLDDEQRLFEVYRSDEGHTKVRRIKIKPEQAGEKLKLSEMWMRGMLGAIPTHF